MLHGAPTAGGDRRGPWGRGFVLGPARPPPGLIPGRRGRLPGQGEAGRAPTRGAVQGPRGAAAYAQARQTLSRSLRRRRRRRHRREAEAEPAAAAAPAAASAPHIAGTPAPGSPAGRPLVRQVTSPSPGPPLPPAAPGTPRLHAPLAAGRRGFRATPERRGRFAGARPGISEARLAQDRSPGLPLRWRRANDARGARPSGAIGGRRGSRRGGGAGSRLPELRAGQSAGRRLRARYPPRRLPPRVFASDLCGT
ncbi:translation initiation factor IF-2 [Oryctolagus cuniculus]|uniref:translation initiation factor IF-2 n=1 Tax=Oryctolagus cuniculus TaxID=9986 RepID=UPI00048FFFAD|nr:translation initiation factor IF-2 [Oryctolagus cuniculus]